MQRSAPIEFKDAAERERFFSLADEYLRDENVRSMDGFMQHGVTTTLAHCLSVAKTAFIINERLRLRADERSLVRTALLHDFYLYDWHDGSGGHRLHGFRHPRTAAENAKRCFDLSDAELCAIRTHMWPFTPLSLPRSRIGWLVCAADKLCALGETIRRKR